MTHNTRLCMIFFALSGALTSHLAKGCTVNSDAFNFTETEDPSDIFQWLGWSHQYAILVNKGNPNYYSMHYSGPAAFPPGGSLFCYEIGPYLNMPGPGTIYGTWKIGAHPHLGKGGTSTGASIVAHITANDGNTVLATDVISADEINVRSAQADSESNLNFLEVLEAHVAGATQHIEVTLCTDAADGPLNQFSFDLYEREIHFAYDSPSNSQPAAPCN